MISFHNWVHLLYSVDGIYFSNDSDGMILSVKNQHYWVLGKISQLKNDWEWFAINNLDELFPTAVRNERNSTNSITHVRRIIMHYYLYIN